MSKEQKRFGLWTDSPAPEAGTYQVNLHLCTVDPHGPKAKVTVVRGFRLPRCPKCGGEANWVFSG